MPIEKTVPTQEVERLIMYCESNNLPLTIGCDTYSHHIAWGNISTNSRGRVLAEYLATTNQENINIGSESTFVSRNRHSIIDVTLATLPTAHEIMDWCVSEEDSMSDHWYINSH